MQNIPYSQDKKILDKSVWNCEVVSVLSNGEAVINGGMGKLCMNCHQSRRTAHQQRRLHVSSGKRINIIDEKDAVPQVNLFDSTSWLNDWAPRENFPGALYLLAGKEPKILFDHVDEKKSCKIGKILIALRLQKTQHPRP